MPSVCTFPRRYVVLTIVALAGMLAWAPPVAAQGFGLGGRVTWVTRDADTDDDTVRIAGGQVRALSKSMGLEVSFDRRSESLDLLDQKVTETPIQASLLLRLASGRVAPFLLAGPGWYRRTVEPLDNANGLSVTTTEFGWHAGGGLEILPSRHFGIHADYRYTFLDFDDDDEDENFVGGLLPGHRGSMWTLGATVYF